MISTLLMENPPLVRSVLVLATVVAVVVAASLAAGGRSGRLIAASLSLVGIGLVVALTLSPVGSGGPRQPACNVEPYNWFGDTPNVALFLLPAVFLAVAMRSAAVVAVLGPLGSAAVELAQYAFPELGRRCDVDDLLANSGGAVAGALMGAVILWSVRLAHRRSPVADTSSRSGTPPRIPEYR